jgi:hypothetical protein
VIAAFAALSGGHASEFGGPENDGVVEESALFEVLEERRQRPMAIPMASGLWSRSMSSWLSQLRRGKPLSLPLQI